MGTRRRNDVDATSLRRVDVVTTSCACWKLAPPWPPKILNLGPPPRHPPQYSKPSYAYGLHRYTTGIVAIIFPSAKLGSKTNSCAQLAQEARVWPADLTFLIMENIKFSNFVQTKDTYYLTDVLCMVLRQQQEAS